MDKVSDELKKLSEQGPIEMLQECSDKNFISPIVITVKKDKTVKLALDSKILNKSIHKNKYQMPNIDSLIDSISQHINNSNQGENVYFSTIDLKFAYSQLNLHPDTARHCNFNIICGDATGTYRFKTGFYGLTDMPVEFQKAMDYTLVGLSNTYCFLDDIIVVSKGSRESHLKYVYDCLKKLEVDNLRINLSKCHFAKHQINWLGFTFSQSGVKPIESKIAAIAEIKAPKTLKQLRSFLGSVHHLSKFIPNLAKICHLLRPLLKKNEKFIWSENHQTHFEHIKTVIANATENTHFNPTLETRIKCDASRQGLGAALEQLDCEGWKTVAFASRFLDSNEKRYSINELELLGVVLAIEYFKYYLFWKNFSVLTDHRALLSVLKSHRSNRSYNSRLTRWIDRLLPFDFNIEHNPGTRMGLVDYISRQPNQNAKSVTQYDEEIMVATISRIRDAITSLFCHSNKVPFHKRHINSKYKLQVNKTRVHSCKPAKSSTPNLNASNSSFTSQTQANNYNRKFISRFNCHANHLLKLDTTIASRIKPKNFNCSSIVNSKQQILHIKMSTNEASQSNPPASPQNPRVTFRTQSTHIQSKSAGPSNVQPSSSPEDYDIELSREEIFENNFNQLFTKSFLAVLTSKDAVLKEIRDCVMQDDEARCKEVSPYIHSFWKDLRVKSGCLCVDQRVAIPNSIKEAVLESIHMTHPASWGMISLSQYAWWPYMHRKILAKTSDCAPCTEIGKNLKTLTPKSKWHPHKACQEPNEEIQIDFGGPIINDKDKDIYFLTCIDRYSKYPTVRIFDNADGVNVVKFLRDYAYTHGIPQTIRLDQATCLVGKQITNHCNENNNNILDAPVGDHRAIGLVERMIQTIKRRLSCMKAENKDTFSTSKAIKQIVSDLRLTKQKTTKITPFEAHFGRPANTPLRNISTLPSSLNLT